MRSLVMSPCSHDLIVTSLVVKLIGTWFLDSELSTCLELKKLPTCMKKCFSEESNLRLPVYTCILITHQTIMLWYVGGLSDIPQTDYYC